MAESASQLQHSQTLARKQTSVNHSNVEASRKMDTYMDPEFWYHKGVVLNKKNTNKTMSLAKKSSSATDNDNKKDAGKSEGNDENAISALKCYM